MAMRTIFAIQCLSKEKSVEFPLLHIFFRISFTLFSESLSCSCLVFKRNKYWRQLFNSSNFGNINGEIKFIDSLKFYQRSLGELSSTLTETEKNVVTKLTEKFLNQHYYFCTIWPYLSCQKKKKKKIRNYIYRERNYAIPNHC